MSTLALFVVLLLVVTGVLFLGAIGCLIDRHPRLVKPLSAYGTRTVVLIAALAPIVALR
ncbi:hypothetical protein ACWDUX_15805 [Streptomyces sp. NPDC003444]